MKGNAASGNRNGGVDVSSGGATDNASNGNGGCSFGAGNSLLGNNESRSRFGAV